MTKESEKENISPEDLELWLQLTQGVKRLKIKKKLGVKAKDLKRQFYKNHSPMSEAHRSLSPDQLHPPIVFTSSEITPSVDPTIGRRIKKRKLSIEATLDLHGMTQRQAYQALIQFIDRCQAQEKRCVLVITGKGSSGDSPGILKQHVPLWLGQPPLKDKIISLSTASLQDGGLGAIYLLIRRSVVI